MTKQNVPNTGAIAARIRALLARTTKSGATEAEAMAAAIKGRELMDRYRLTLTDFEIQVEPIVEGTVDCPNKRRYAPVDNCLYGIAAYCGIRTWFTISGEGRRLHLFGLHADVKMARYLYEMIGSAIESECYRWRLSAAYRESDNRHHSATAFKLGMACRIGDRYGARRWSKARLWRPLSRTSN